jgi:hypothetical protein
MSGTQRISIDRYVVETLMGDLVGHDKRPSAFIVYLFLWFRSAGRRTRGVEVSHQTMAEETGLSKSAVQVAIRLLLRRRLLRSRRASPTAIPEYFVLRPWVRKPG